MTTHRFLQLHELADKCRAQAVTYFRCATKADRYGNRAAAAHFRARATKHTRIATTAERRMGI